MKKRIYIRPFAELERVDPCEDILLTSQGQSDSDDMLNIDLGYEDAWE